MLPYNIIEETRWARKHIHGDRGRTNWESDIFVS